MRGVFDKQNTDHPFLIERPSPIVIGCKLMRMNLATHFQMLARYNRIANERLFAKCAQLGGQWQVVASHGSTIPNP